MPEELGGGDAFVFHHCMVVPENCTYVWSYQPTNVGTMVRMASSVYTCDERVAK